MGFHWAYIGLLLAVFQMWPTAFQVSKCKKTEHGTQNHHSQAGITLTSALINMPWTPTVTVTRRDTSGPMRRYFLVSAGNYIWTMWCISDPSWRFCRYVILARVLIPEGPWCMSATPGFVAQSVLSGSSKCCVIVADIVAFRHGVLYVSIGCSCAHVTNSCVCVWYGYSLERLHTVPMTPRVELHTTVLYLLYTASKNMFKGIGIKYLL